MPVGPGLCVQCRVKLRPKRFDRENSWRSICHACDERNRKKKYSKIPGKINSQKHINPASLICESCKINPKYRRSDRKNCYRPYCSTCLHKRYNPTPEITLSSDDEILTSYVTNLIKIGSYKGEITEDLIETKKLSLMLHRAIKKFKANNNNQ
jgi:hypothetical protein